MSTDNDGRRYFAHEDDVYLRARHLAPSSPSVLRPAIRPPARYTVGQKVCVCPGLSDLDPARPYTIAELDEAGDRVRFTLGPWRQMRVITCPYREAVPPPSPPHAAIDLKAKHAQRKARPIARGALDYFPDALAEVANVSRVANEQHNPGEPMHWAFGKSMDHADCVVRHLADRGTIDDDDLPHSAKVAWRALALLQTELEAADPVLHAAREAQRAKSAKGER